MREIDEVRMTLNDEDKQYIKEEITRNKRILENQIKRAGSGRKTERWYYGVLYSVEWYAEDDGVNEYGKIQLGNRELLRHIEEIYIDDYDLFHYLKRRIGEEVVLEIGRDESGKRGNEIRVLNVIERKTKESEK